MEPSMVNSGTDLWRNSLDDDGFVKNYLSEFLDQSEYVPKNLLEENNSADDFLSNPIEDLGKLTAASITKMAYNTNYKTSELSTMDHSMGENDLFPDLNELPIRGILMSSDEMGLEMVSLDTVEMGRRDIVEMDDTQSVKVERDDTLEDEDHQVVPQMLHFDIESNSLLPNDSEALMPQFQLLLDDNNNYMEEETICTSPEGSSSNDRCEENVANDQIESDRGVSLLNSISHLRKTKLNVNIIGQASNKRSRRRGPQLWVFLLNQLCDDYSNPSLITWTDWKNGIFKLTSPHELADIWGNRVGIKSGKNPMTYEKFARGIRYYYKEQIILSAVGRLTYRFGPGADGWRKAAADHNQKMSVENIE